MAIFCTMGRRSVLATVSALAVVIAIGGCVSAPVDCLVTSLTLSGAPVNLAVGRTATLTATIAPVCSGVTIVWTSRAPQRITVSQTGVVTGVAAGAPVIVLAAIGTGVDSVSIIPISGAVAAEVDVDPATATLAAGTSKSFTAVTIAQTGDTIPGMTFTWSNPEEGTSGGVNSGPYYVMVVGNTAIGLRQTIPPQGAAIVATTTTGNTVQGNAQLQISAPSYTGHLIGQFLGDTSAPAGFISLVANGSGLMSVGLTGDAATETVIDATSDAQTVIYLTQRSPTYKKLWTASISGQNTHLLATDDLTGAHTIGGVAVSTVAPYRVAYFQGKPGTADTLYAVNADGTNLHVLAVAASGAPIGNPAWSPDGNEVSFVVPSGAGGMATFAANADGSGSHQVGAVSTNPATALSFSPDRTRYTYVELQQLLVTTVAAGTTSTLTLPAYLSPVAGSIRWSPDGTTLAFVADSMAARRSAYLINADGSGLRLAYNESAVAGFYQLNATSVDWSPDGASLVMAACMARNTGSRFACDNRFDVNSIAVVQLDGSHLAFVTPFSVVSYAMPIWRQ